MLKLAIFIGSATETTPPCETVDWLVTNEPEEVAQADIERFA
jgi:carbonic anhydrase